MTTTNDTAKFELFWTATGNRFASGFATADEAIAWGRLSAGAGFGARWDVRAEAACTHCGGTGAIWKGARFTSINEPCPICVKAVVR